MCNLKIIVNTSDDVERYQSLKPKRPRRALRVCLLCQARKIKCTGSSPCEGCIVRKVECVYNKNLAINSDRVAKASSDKRATTRPTGDSWFKSRPSLTPAPSSIVRGQSYFRYLGPTAVAVTNKPVALGSDVAHGHPSSGRCKLSLAPTTSSPVKGMSPEAAAMPGTWSDSTHQNQSAPVLDLEYGPDRSDLPELPDSSFVTRFYTLMGSYLPYIDSEIFERTLNRGPLSMSLLYSIAALVSRVHAVDIVGNRDGRANSCTHNGSVSCRSRSNSDCNSADVRAKAALYTKASKALVLPYISTPCLDVVYTMVLIAYNEFAEAREAALWTWSGMAIRMCYDLGLNNPQHAKVYDQILYKNVFGSVVCLDRFVSLSTGRKTTIPDHDLTALNWLDRSDHKLLRTPPRSVEYHSPVRHLCHLMTIAGRISNFINSNQHRDQLALDSTAVADCLSVLTEFHTQLPTELYLDISNFQAARNRKQSQAFLMIHAWHQALLIVIHCPPWSHNVSLGDALSAAEDQHGLSRSQCDAASRCISNIGDMLSLADLIDQSSYLASPFIAQPLHLAASTAIHLFKLRTNSPYRDYSIKKAYVICRSALARMQPIWQGISSHLRSLDGLYSASVGNDDVFAVQASDSPHPTHADELVTDAPLLGTTSTAGGSGVGTSATYKMTAPAVVPLFGLGSTSFTEHSNTDSLLPCSDMLDTSSVDVNEWESEMLPWEMTDWATAANVRHWQQDAQVLSNTCEDTRLTDFIHPSLYAQTQEDEIGSHPQPGFCVEAMAGHDGRY